MNDRKLYEDSSITSSWKVHSDSAIHLRAAVDMCFPNERTTFTHFKKDGPKLMLYWGEYGAKKDEADLLPYPLTKENAYDFIYAWLDSYPQSERSHDGQGVGFDAEWFDFGENFNVMFHAINIYYGK